MGTSSARRGPATRLWRLAKGAASRFLSPESGGMVTAREVAARYVAALVEGDEAGPAGALAAFRLTRRTAQNLGAFACQADSQGCSAALEAFGLPDWAGEKAGVLAPALAAVLGVPGHGLEQAVVHNALVAVLLQHLAELGQGETLPWQPARLVRDFLAETFQRRLALDLGESMEAVAAGFSPLREGLTEMAAWIEKAAAGFELPAAPLTPEHWLGLPGWTWVTNMLAGLLSRLSQPQR